MEENILEVLCRHSKNRPSDIAFQILGRDGELIDEANYRSLWETSFNVAVGISARCQKGDRVIISMPTELNYIYTFLGCLISGVIAVPFYPVKNRKKAKYLADISRSCNASLIVTANEDSSKVGLFVNELQLSANVTSVEQLLVQTGALSKAHKFEDKDTVAYIQYTSGSTSKPKGVSITNGNILANTEYLTKTVCGTSKDVFVNWLPLYHDMGLVITVLWPIYLGAKSILMPSSFFVSSPYGWLKAISDYRGSICGGPNFCYDLCVDKIEPSLLSSLDLTGWEIAFNSAEPIQAKTLDRFSGYFVVSGFNKQALYPCYGMAEATVFFSGKHRLAGYRSLYIDKDMLSRNQVVLIDPSAGSGSHIVDCGSVDSSHSFKILGLDTQSIRKDLEIGEICVKGPSIFRDYWANNIGNDLSFRNGNDISLDGNSYFKTGDIGFSYERGLFLTGRLKDIIIVKGKNYYPNDIENGIYDAHYSIRRGGCAVIVLHGEQHHELVAVIEIKREFIKNVNTRVLEGIVRKHVLSDQNICLDAIVFTPPFTIPLTSSGKVQRSKLASLYQLGSLKGFNENCSPKNEVIHPFSSTEKALMIIWSTILKRDIISIDSDYFELGGTSIEAIEILSGIHDKFPQIEIQQDILMKYSNVASLARFIDLCLLKARSKKESKSKQNIISV